MPKEESASQSSELRSEEDVIANRELPHDEIAQVAYALWEARGRAEGSPEQDWFEAERQLREPKTQTEAA